MKTAQATPGRRVIVLLEPGDDVLGAVVEACREHRIDQASISTFSGALRSATIIAGHEPAVDPESPLTDSVTVRFVEGIGSGMVTTDADGAVVPHVHVAMGVKDDGGSAVAGHLLRGEAHYVVEIVLDEILSPTLRREARASTSGVPALTFGALSGEDHR